jgi:hypothetical protein
MSTTIKERVFFRFLNGLSSNNLTESNADAPGSILVAWVLTGMPDREPRKKRTNRAKTLISASLRFFHTPRTPWGILLAILSMLPQTVPRARL